MARFVSRYANYSHGVREEVAEVFARGTRVIVRGLEAQFSTRGITTYEKEQASQLMSFTGLPEDRETGGNVSPYSRLSVFDSEISAKENRWTEEEKEAVLTALRESSMKGVEFVEVESARRPAPWNGYDRLETAEKIAELAIATETSISEVIAYEKENQAREDVLVELELLLEETPSDEIVVEA